MKIKLLKPVVFDKELKPVGTIIEGDLPFCETLILIGRAEKVIDENKTDEVKEIKKEKKKMFKK